MNSVLAVPKLRPRDCITVNAIGGVNVSEQMVQVAKLRLHHPGGVPLLEPMAWSAAFAGSRVVAAMGYFQIQKNHLIVTEINRSEDHWGAVGLIVLVRQFIAVCKAMGIRVQALVIPDNLKLKKALRESKIHLACEVWEPD